MRFFTNNLRQIFKNLLIRKGRSFLTILGIMIGVAGVVIIVSLGRGAQSLIVDQVSKLGTNLIAVLPGKSNETGPPAAVFGVQTNTLTLNDIEAIKREINSIENVAPLVSGRITIIFDNQNIDTSFVATEGEYVNIQNIEMENGEFFSPEQSRAGSNVIVLGYSVREELFPNGNEIGKIVKLRIGGEDSVSVPFRIIGVQKKMGTVAFQNQDDQVYIPFVIGQRQLLGINYVQFIRAKIKSGEDVKETISEVRRVLRNEHKIKNIEDEDFSVRDLADAIKVLSGITDTLRIFLGLMAGVSLIVGGIGIMNIMLVTVSERTREIGLRKALGATKKKIRDQFLFEAILLTSIGGFLGIIIGIFISYLISLGARYAGYAFTFSIPLLSILLAFGVSFLTGIIFGMYPAIKASKLDPIEALKYE